MSTSVLYGIGKKEQKSNKAKYCPKCARKIKLEQTRDIARESMKKLRQNKSMLRK